MNRSRSDDSLDNGLNDVATSGSSSPIDFTSDDEGGSSDCWRMECAQRLNNKMDMAERFFRNAEMALRKQMADLPTRSSSHNNHLSGDSANDPALQQSVASTSYYNKSDPNNDYIDLHPSRIPGVVPGSLSADQIYGRPYNPDQILCDSVGFRPLQNSERRFADLNDYNVIDTNVYLEHNPSMDPSIRALAGPSQGTAACRMCARLVECRTLSEAIEFIDSNRALIDTLTRIVTTDAPAFRDYDMNMYQIDSSVKESFNPNFWLDREPVITTADGNCQYHAVSIGLTGSEMYTQEVRLATAVAVVDNRDWFDSMLKLIDRGNVLDLVHTIARSYSWGDETTLKAVAVAINRRIFLYTCNIGKKDYEMVKSLSKEELLDAFKEKKYRGGTGIHTYADPLIHVPANNYIMLFHKSEH